jgi:hypothetical protein
VRAAEFDLKYRSAAGQELERVANARIYRNDATVQV